MLRGNRDEPVSYTHLGKMQLQKAGIETPAFDAVCLFEKVFKLDRQGLILHGGETEMCIRDRHWCFQ